jgi:hypothetical protein
MKRDGYATCLPLALSVSREERWEVLACFHVVVKMYRYSLEERVFIVKAYWITGSIENCQRRFVEQFGGRNPPLKCCIQLLVTKYYLFMLPTSSLRIPKTHNRISLQVWHANVLHFSSFCKPTFSGATREWDALYYPLKKLSDSGRFWGYFVYYIVIIELVTSRNSYPVGWICSCKVWPKAQHGWEVQQCEKCIV